MNHWLNLFGPARKSKQSVRNELQVQAFNQSYLMESHPGELSSFENSGMRLVIRHTRMHVRVRIEMDDLHPSGNEAFAQGGLDDRRLNKRVGKENAIEFLEKNHCQPG
jgi:hypothetical protein